MKLLFADWIFIAGLILLIGAHVTTNFLITYYSDAAKVVGVAEDAVLVMEANPIARWFFGIDSARHIFSYAIAPAMVTGMYWFLRRKYYNERPVLEAYAVGFLCLATMDFLNDASIALGVLV